MYEPIIAADATVNKQGAVPPPTTTPADLKQEIGNAKPEGKPDVKPVDNKNEKTQAHTVQPVPKKEAPPQQNTLLSLLSSPMVPLILIFVVMIFFMNRSQKKQMQKRQEMIDSITKGTKVLLTSGIYGTVDAVQEDTMTVEIAAGVKIKIAKAGIADVVTEGAKTEEK